MTTGVKWAAIGLPFLLGAGFARAQTMGLPAPMSGDCTTNATGTVVCTKANGVALANSATTDATNAANITSGVLPLAQVPVLTGAKLPTGAPGTVTSYNAAGVQAPAAAPLYTATVGPIKVAPFAVSAQTAAGTLIGPANGATSYRIANITNGARLLTSGVVTQVKTFIGTTTGATGLYFELWRVNSSGTFNLVCRSANLLSGVTNSAANTFALTTPCNAQGGDYPAMVVTGSFSGATPFSSSTAYPAAAYPTYAASNAQMGSTEDFLGGTTGATYAAVQNAPIEVYEAKGPVVVGLGDSKMQGIPLSGDFLQAAGNYSFPVAAQANYSTATTGTSLIDLSNQPIAWVGRILGYTFANLGITGSTSTTQLAQSLPTALALKPAVLVLSGTINDAAFSVPTNTSVANFTSMYNQAIAAGVQKVVMTGVEPAGYSSEAVWSNATYGPDALNAGLKSFCQAQAQCVWIGDQVMAALGQYRTGGAAGSLHNIQPAYAAADNLHFNNAGAQMMGLLEANAIEPPTAVGTAVAVPNVFGTATRSRAVVTAGHDGSLGWRWQDVRDYLQMDSQGLDNAPMTAGAAAPGQQSVGCVTFAAGKGYVRCDGGLTWSQQNQTLTAATVYAPMLKTGYYGNTQFAATGTYTGLTFNANNTDGSRLGLVGGGSSDSNLYVDVPAGGAITLRVGNAIVASQSATAFSTKHLVGNSASPTVAVGAAAASCTVAGTDVAFTLTCTTGASPAAGVLGTVTFAGAYGAAPHFAAPGAMSAASAAASASVFATSSTTALTVSTANALAASTSYAWHYVLVQ